jgi:hypothetical protein
MNLDTIKFGMQTESLDFPYNLYDKSELQKADANTTFTKFMLNPNCNNQIGLKSIQIHPYNNEVIVECSAKILEEQYLDGINPNTLERLHNSIKPYIHCSLNDVEKSTLFKADITKNLYFDTQEQKEFAIQSLKLGKSNVGFKVDDYTDKRESIIFTGRQTSYKNRQIYYNKEKELYSSKSKNREILNILIKHKVKDIDKILRVEQNVTSFDKLRQATGKHIRDKEMRDLLFLPSYVNNVLLGEALYSEKNPILERHQIIMKYANQVNLYDKYETFDDAMFDYGIKGIYSECNQSWELVLDFLDKKTPKKYLNKNGYLRHNGTYYRMKNKIQFHISNNIVECSPYLVNNFEKKDEMLEKEIKKNSYMDALKQIELLLLVA